MFVVVAIDAQQLPVAAVGWIVIVIVVAMMHGELTDVAAIEFAAAAPADPRVQFQRLFAIALLARVRVTPRSRNDCVELALIDWSRHLSQRLHREKPLCNHGVPGAMALPQRKLRLAEPGV